MATTSTYQYLTDAPRSARLVPLLIAGHCLLSLLTFVLLCVAVAKARESLADAAVTLHGVDLVVPEVNRALGILQQLCTNVLRDYCGTPA